MRPALPDAAGLHARTAMDNPPAADVHPGMLHLAPALPEQAADNIRHIRDFSAHCPVGNGVVLARCATSGNLDADLLQQPVREAAAIIRQRALPLASSAACSAAIQRMSLLRSVSRVRRIEPRILAPQLRRAGTAPRAVDIRVAKMLPRKADDC